MYKKIILVSDRITEYFLYLLIFFVSFSPAGVEICFGFAYFFWIIKRIINRKLRGTSYLPHTKLDKPLLAFIVANAISVILSVDFTSSIKPFFSKVLEYVIIFLMVVDTINTRKRIRNLLTVIIFTILLISTDATVQYFRGVDFLRGYPLYGQHLRLKASFVSPNDFAAWLNIMIFVMKSISL